MGYRDKSSSTEPVGARKDAELSMYTAWVQGGRGRPNRIEASQRTPDISKAMQSVDAQLMGEGIDGNSTAIQKLKSVRVVRRQLLAARDVQRESRKGPCGDLLLPPEFPRLAYR